MGKKKYIKNSNGVTMSVTTDTLGLEKPLLNENYDIDVHNRNMDKIDEDLKPIDDSYIIELFQHDGDATNPRDYYTKVEADEKFATKEETNNALNKANEAFQRGDNVKTQLVDKLISEGLNVSTNNTFEELIGSIALGKKYASGSQVSSTGSTTLSLQLGFSPRLVFINFDYASGSNSKLNRFTIFFKDANATKSCNIVSGYSPSYQDVVLREDGIDIYAKGYDEPNTFYWYAFE